MATAVATSLSFDFSSSFSHSSQQVQAAAAPLKRDAMDNNTVDNGGMRLALQKMHKKMRKKEQLQQQKRSFTSHSDQIYQQCRHAVVDWVSQVGEVCGLRNLTIHAAIGFVDMLLDITPIDTSRIQLVAMACILIAAKMEELEDKVPRVHTLTSLSGNIFSREQVLKMESWILNAFKWEVNIITPLNFLEYYLKEASLGPSEMTRNTHLRNYELTKTHLCKTAEFFVDLSEHHSYFREYLPSVVAAAALAAARQMLRIQPVWTDSLQLVTAHTFENILDCMTNLWSYYQQTFPSQDY